MRTPTLLTPFWVKGIMRAVFPSDLERVISSVSLPCVVNMTMCVCMHARKQHPQNFWSWSLHWKPPLQFNVFSRECTTCTTSVSGWMSLWLRCFGSWTYNCARCRRISSQMVRAGGEWWRFWTMLISGHRTNLYSRFQTLDVECARQFLISLQPTVFLSVILQHN